MRLRKDHIPDKLKDILAQLHNRDDNKEDEN